MILDNKIYGLLTQIALDNKNRDGFDKKDITTLKYCLEYHAEMFLRYSHLTTECDFAQKIGDHEWADIAGRKIDVEFLDNDGPKPMKKKGV